MVGRETVPQQRAVRLGVHRCSSDFRAQASRPITAVDRSAHLSRILHGLQAESDRALWEAMRST